MTTFNSLRLVVFGSLLLSSFTYGTTAIAQTEPAAAPQANDPQVPFDEGRALMKANRFAEAAQKFEQSLAIKTTSGALLNLGDCYEKLGRYATAVASFDKARDLSEKAGDAARAQEANARAVPLRGNISTIKVQLSSNVAGATLTIDKNPVDIGAALPVDGGEHVVAVTAPCHKPYEERVSVGLKGDAKTVTPALVTNDGEAGCGGQVTTDGSLLGKNQKLIGIIAGGVGVVALGAGAFFGLSASSKKSDLESACTSYPRGCPVARRGELDGIASDADSAAMISTIAFIAGGVLVAGGAFLFFTAKGEKTTGTVGRAVTTGASLMTGGLSF